MAPKAVTCALKRKRCETLRPLFACLRCTRLGLKCAYDRKRAPGRIPTGGRRPKAIERVDALPLPPELSALAFELQKQEDQLESQSVSSSGWNWLPPSPTASDASIDISLVSVPTQLYSAASLFSAALDHSQCHPWPHLSSFKRDALLANLAKWHTKHSDSGLEDFDRLAALLFYHSASAVLVCPREHVPLNLFGWAGGEDCVAAQEHAICATEILRAFKGMSPYSTRPEFTELLKSAAQMSARPHRIFLTLSPDSPSPDADELKREAERMIKVHEEFIRGFGVGGW